MQNLHSNLVISRHVKPPKYLALDVQFTFQFGDFTIHRLIPSLIVHIRIYIPIW